MSKKSLFESLQERNNQTNTALDKDKFNKFVNEINELTCGLIKVEKSNISFQLYEKGKVGTSTIRYFETDIDTELTQEIKEQVENFVALRPIDLLCIFGSQCETVNQNYIIDVEKLIVDKSNKLYEESIMELMKKN